MDIGRTALQAAAGMGNIDLIEILLEVGADANAPPAPRRGVTALQAAAIKGYIRVAQLLLDAGADVNAAPAAKEGRTALQGAAEHGRIDMLQLLINAGADIYSSGYDRAIELATEYGHSAACTLLNRCRSEGMVSGYNPQIPSG
ncbi:ankyrin [Thozetella sp. PMI_491]|nr:ankyrin [Thozetella sp. PMI_491]